MYEFQIAHTFMYNRTEKKKWENHSSEILKVYHLPGFYLSQNYF